MTSVPPSDESLPGGQRPKDSAEAIVALDAAYDLLVEIGRRARGSLIGKVEYDPDTARVVDGLVDVLTYRQPSTLDTAPTLTPSRRTHELTPAQQAKARAAHARRLAAEKREGER